MNPLRTYRNSWGRFVLSMFVVSWLSVSLQPCLMAMETGSAMDMESGHSSHVMRGENVTGADAAAMPFACRVIRPGRVSVVNFRRFCPIPARTELTRTVVSPTDQQAVDNSAPVVPTRVELDVAVVE